MFVTKSDNSDDGELKDLLKQFISMMAKKEMQEQQSSIKTKKVEEKFDGDPEGFSE